MEDVKIKISALWVAFFFNSIYGDVMRLYGPGMLEQLIAGGIGAIQMTHEMLLVSAITMEIPIIMGFLSLVLKDKANRIVNMIIGIFFVLYNLMFLISSISTLIAWEIFLAAILIVFAILIVWYAWKWPKQPFNK